jgi:NAD(P)H-hydrate epimerase
MNRHQFEQAAKHFRAGRLTLTDFSAQVFPEQHPQANSDGASKPAIAAVPKRKVDAHKGDFGRVLLIGGSATMPGAISLAGLAALRSGSGLVVIATPKYAAQSVASFSPCYMTQGYELDEGVPASLQELCDWADVIGLGPGLGVDKDSAAMVVELYRSAPQPMVVDADGLNCLAQSGADLGTHDGRRILTPHPGEFRTLAQKSTTSREEMETMADELASACDVSIVLKGHRTFVTDGKQNAYNETGNVGMATAGSGDVLTGMIASLVGQGMKAFDAARAACHFHGLAGDLGAKRLGQVSLISSDLIDFLPQAFNSTSAKK